MRVLLCMYDLHAGGAETQFRYLTEGLIRTENIELVFLFERLDHDSSGESLKSLHDYGVLHHDLKMQNHYTLLERALLKFKLGRIINKKLYTKIEQFLKTERKFDWVITYNYTFLPYVELFHKYGAKVLFSERNDGQWIPRIKNGISFVKKCDVVTCNSLLAKQMIYSCTGVEAKYIKNGIQVGPENYCPDRKRNYNILIPARISPEKNQCVVIEALSQKDASAYNLIICGGISSQDYFEKLQAKVSAKLMSERVSFAGFQKNMVNYYHDAACMILPSFIEGTPNAILESFAYGTPVIASNIAANEVLFEDKSLLFSPESPSDLLRALSYIFSMSDMQLTNMIKRSYEFVIQEYSIDRMCENYLNLLMV